MDLLLQEGVLKEGLMELYFIFRKFKLLMEIEIAGAFVQQFDGIGTHQQVSYQLKSEFVVDCFSLSFFVSRVSLV